MHRRFRTGLALAAALVAAATLAGCNSVGPRAVRGARAAYNDALIATWNEQLLLNLVRLRYRDTPFFLEVSSVSTQYVLSGSAGLTGFHAGSGVDLEGGGGGFYEERPTVTWSPLSGEGFVRALLSPIPLETLFLLPENGWSVERVLRCCVQSLNGRENAPTAAGPTPDDAPVFRDFRRVARLLRELQRARLLELRQVERCDDPAPGEPGDGAAEDAADAAGCRRKSWALRLRVLPVDEVVARHPSDAAELRRRAEGRDEKLAEVASLLGLREPREEIRFVPPGPAAEAGSVELVPRSLMGVLFYLSQAVEVPVGDLDAGRVTRSFRGAAESRAEFDWAEVTGGLLRIRSRATRPEPGEAFVTVPYRGAWFYIADDDPDSKSTFGLVAQLFSLQSGERRSLAPTFTLGLGG